MKFRILGYAALLVSISFVQGCAVLFSSSKQYVDVYSTTPDAKISMDGDSVGVGKAHVRLNKYKVYNTFTAEKEGFKSRSYCVSLDRYSPTIMLAIPDALAVVVPTFLVYRKSLNDPSIEYGEDLAIIPAVGLFAILSTDLRHAKTHRYEKNSEIPALEPLTPRKEDEKFLLVNNISIDMKKDDQRYATYSKLSKYENASSKSQRGSAYSKEDLKIDNTIFKGSLNYTLHKMNFVDTTNKIFPNIGNALYINATIKRVTFHIVKSPFANTAQYSGGSEYVMPNHLFAVELAIDWEVLDYYKQKVASIRTVEKSDLSTIAYKAGKDNIQEKVYAAMKDNMDFSIMSLRRQLEDKKFLKVTKEKENIEKMEITRPEMTIRTKDDLRKSCVTVVSGDEYGTGTIISEDGYIVTSYHLVAGGKAISVTLEDSTTAEAEIVRRNTESNLVLLKVKKTGLIPFILSEDTDPEIGVDVWALGIAGNAEMGISLSHGIVSGIRKMDGMQMLQTDASLNKGSAGGPLVTEKGTVAGIVLLKITGRGVEGLGFALAAHEILERLKLKYK